MTVRGGEVLGPRRGTRGMSLFPDSRRGLAGWGGEGGGAGSETDGGDPKSPQLPVQRERDGQCRVGRTNLHQALRLLYIFAKRDHSVFGTT